MKTSSAKAKGRRCAQEAKNKLVMGAMDLQDDDIVVTSSGETGKDLKLSPMAHQFYPFAIECKNQEKLNVRAAFDQAKSHRGEKDIPLLIHTKNRSKMLATLTLDDLVYLCNR